MKKTDVFYDVEQAEVLSYNDREEAIYGILDGEPSLLPVEITLIKYKRIDMPPPSPSEVTALLENQIEFLDENYGGEDCTEIEKGMVDLCNNFLLNLYKLYVPWRCEEVSRESVNCKKWVTENEPRWIAEDDIDFEEDQLKEKK